MLSEQVIAKQGAYRLTAVYENKSDTWKHPYAGRFDKPPENFTPDVVCVTTKSDLVKLVIAENVGTVQPGTIETWKNRHEFTSDQTKAAVEKFRELVNRS